MNTDGMLPVAISIFIQSLLIIITDIIWYLIWRISGYGRKSGYGRNRVISCNKKVKLWKF